MGYVVKYTAEKRELEFTQRFSAKSQLSHFSAVEKFMEIF